MSNLRTIDLNAVADLVDFIRGAGYVLDFSDTAFAEFFANELDVDIDHARYADRGGSKGKRLRRFLELVDDKTALKTLRALWEVRQDFLLRTGREDPVANSEARYLALLNRLGGSPSASAPQEQPKAAFDFAKIDALKAELVGLSSLAPQQRGFAFEAYLQKLFIAYNLKPREPFRNVGEQIDGSFVMGEQTYLMEAKWQQLPTGQADLLIFEGKLMSKAAWARGLFVSYSGFTAEGLRAFGSGKRTICMNGEDMWEMLNRRLPFDHVIDRKQRRAVETGLPFVGVRDLF
ncbi:hypothetical protein [Brevundimonas aurantiaca]|uniref:hypothetical protein n=1 Tax=Brevundimonas aurantiaca TaxID=74316 RepID=UPI0030194A10